MMVEAPGPINFTMFLTMFGEKLNGTDPEDVIKNAFGCFDEENTGQCGLYLYRGSSFFFSEISVSIFLFFFRWGGSCQIVLYFHCSMCRVLKGRALNLKDQYIGFP